MARFAMTVDTGARDDPHSVERWMDASGTHNASPCHAVWGLGPVGGAGGEPVPKYFDLSALLKITQSPVAIMPSMSGGHSEHSDDLDRDELPVAWQNVSAAASTAASFIVFAHILFKRRRHYHHYHHHKYHHQRHHQCVQFTPVVAVCLSAN